MKFGYALAVALVLFNQPTQARAVVADALDEAKVGISARFVPIQGGSFIMGSPEYQSGHEADELEHEVTLTRDFEMQLTEVTQLQYYLVMGKNPSLWVEYEYGDKIVRCPSYSTAYGPGLCAQGPVERVSWEDAQEFIRRLNATGGAYRYRLPTEAEWEFAARAGTVHGFSFSFGDEPMERYGWFWHNSPAFFSVATKLANPFGLFDMHGGVYEWVQDFYGAYSSAPTTDPIGDLGTTRVIRGGAARVYATYARSANRGDREPTEKEDYVGFRLVRQRVAN
jgi:formylglycine-generating enzyme required for sulfatase activity